MTTQTRHQGQFLDPKRRDLMRDVSKDAPNRIALFESAFTGNSLRSAINAFCLSCVWMDPVEVRKCTATSCPLWAVRPYQTKTKTESMKENSL